MIRLLRSVCNTIGNSVAFPGYQTHQPRPQSTFPDLTMLQITWIEFHSEAGVGPAGETDAFCRIAMGRVPGLILA